MADAAAALLSSLSAAQRAAVRFPLSDETERRNWHYTPRERRGLPLRDMSQDQRRLAYGLVSAGLSLEAYAKATAVVMLERVLDRIEGGRRARDPGDYFTSVFGDPTSGAWGWRFEGHHVSFNYTLSAGRVASCTPCFLGSNPAEVTHRGRVVSRPLAEEEDLARELLSGLDPDRRARAVVSPSAPPDLLTGNRPAVGEVGQGGLAAVDMEAAGWEALWALIRCYLERVPADVATACERRLSAQAERIRFVWAGEELRRRPHYYRVEGPGLLIEYDNTQNDANHVHSVWREPGKDFGGSPRSALRPRR